MVVIVVIAKVTSGGPDECIDIWRGVFVANHICLYIHVCGKELVI